MRKHSLDLVSLLAGLLFTGFAVAYIVGAYADARIDPRYAVPLVLVGLGVAGLAGSLIAQRRSDRALLASEQADSDA